MSELEPRGVEIQPPRSRLIVEVGAGHYDGGHGYWEPTPARRTFKPAEIYVGLDWNYRQRDPRSTEEAEWHERAQKPTGNVFYLRADGTRLPFPENVADEVLFFNVFCSGTRSDPSILLREASRVSRPGGKIIIQDDMTPTYGAPIMPAGIEKASPSVWDMAQFRDEYDQLAEQYGFRPSSLVSAIGIVHILHAVQTD